MKRSYPFAIHRSRFAVSPFSVSRVYSAQLVPPEDLIFGAACANERIEIA